MSSASPFHIRPASLQDLSLLVDFQMKMAMETENRRLKLDTVTRGLRRALECPEFGAQLFVAFVHEGEEGEQQKVQSSPSSGEKETVVACMMLTSEFDLFKGGTIIWFQSVYVIEAYRRRGCFRNFFRFVKERAESDPGVVGIRLDVDCTNEKAQSTYTAQGMHLEGVRVTRWCPPGVEPEDADAAAKAAESSKHNDNPQQQKEAPPAPLPSSSSSNAVASSAKKAIRIRRVGGSGGGLDEVDFVDRVIVPLQIDCARRYYNRFAGDSADHQQQQQQQLVKKGVHDVLANGKKLGAALYVAELVAADAAGTKTTTNQQEAQVEVVGAAVSTSEWSDWRDGFAMWLENVAVKYNEMRQDVFRAFLKHFRDMASEKNSDVTGVRFVYEHAVEINLPDSERVDKVAIEEGMFLERYYLMRYDKQ